MRLCSERAITKNPGLNAAAEDRDVNQERREPRDSLLLTQDWRLTPFEDQQRKKVTTS
jgi:hypothetical protein